MSTEIVPPPLPADPRRDGILEAAVGVFTRFGFRKTSMDEVARAAGLSRQGLYLQFADKESLFREAVDYKLSAQLNAATRALAGDRDRLELRLVAACDEWAGRHIGNLGDDATDLLCAGKSLAGATLARYGVSFETALAQAIAASALARFCHAAGLSPLDVARSLHATVRGLKHSVGSRQEFLHGITVAVSLFCAPLSCPLPHEN